MSDLPVGSLPLYPLNRGIFDLTLPDADEACYLSRLSCHVQSLVPKCEEFFRDYPNKVAELVDSLIVSTLIYNRYYPYFIEVYAHEIVTGGNDCILFLRRKRGMKVHLYL